ncbi:MAG: cobalamin biosynthesis protein CobT [Rickettsiales bacterium]|nr:cobalamin biosynthesis protein CobT [Rickettsiales bacterium]
MLKNENLIEEFKKSLSITVKSIGKNNNLEINFVKENPSIDGNSINLTDPNIESLKNNLTYIRAEADSLALEFRLHSKDIHQNFIANNELSNEIFNAVEQSRIEAQGSKIFKGIKSNILKKHILDIKNQNTFKGEIRIPDAFKYVTYAELLNIDLGKNYQPFKKVIKNKLKNRYNDFFNKLKKSIKDQEKFAANMKDILVELGIFDVDENAYNKDQNQENNIEDQNNNKEVDDNGNDKSENSEQMQAQSEEMQQNVLLEDNDEIGEDSNESELDNLPKIESLEKIGDYKVYTNKYDEIVNAHELCDLKELEKLRNNLDQQVFGFQPLIAKIANRLQRRLLAQQNRHWEFNTEEGFLDTSRLSKIIANPNNKLSFKIEKEIEFKDTIVSLLIDNSGSMRGRPITVAALCSDILARTLERCLIKTEILGFTTKAWKGGESREIWIKNGKPSNPGRLNDLRHIIYKSADAPWRRSKKNLGLLLREGILKENVDGEALKWAFKRLEYRYEKRKILIVISDGAPVDDSTLSVNPGNYLEKNLRDVIKHIENRTNVELIAIGIGHDVSRYYSKAVTIMDVDQLGEVLLQELSDVFSTK